MPNNRSVYIISLCVVFFAVSIRSHAQTEKGAPESRGEYAMVAYISGGLGYYATKAGTPVAVTAKTSKLGPASTIRILWHPDHLLRVGFETGYMTFYSYTIKDSTGKSGKSSLTGIPLLIVASMPVTARLNAFFGTGFFSMSTNLDYAGQKTAAHKFGVGWMLAASYVHPLNKRMGLGTELKWMDAAETGDASVCVQLQLVWKFLTW